MGEGQHGGADAARTYSTLAGGLLILFGLAGFFYSADFARGDALVAEKAFGLFYVNGWQNLLHLAAGALGLVLAVRGARLYCFAAGVIWIVLAAGGFFGSHGGETVPAMAGMIPAGTANNLFNLTLGALGLAALAASAPSSKPSSKAKPTGKTQPKVEPESRQESSIGRPRSARPTRSGGRRAIN